MTLSEAELAAEVVAYLEKGGWDVYQEVQLPGSQDRADIVARSATHVLVAECKLSLSFDLMEQGRRWKPYANMVVLAVPYAKPNDGRRLAFRICERYLALGVLEVGDGPEPRTAAPSPVLSREDDALLSALRPEHKAFAKAGTPSGGQYTGFQGTAQKLEAYVAAHPGEKLPEALEAIGHHYRSGGSANENLEKHIRKGLIPNVHLGWKGRLYPTKQGARTGVDGASDG